MRWGQPQRLRGPVQRRRKQPALGVRVLWLQVSPRTLPVRRVASKSQPAVTRQAEAQRRVDERRGERHEDEVVEVEVKRGRRMEEDDTASVLLPAGLVCANREATGSAAHLLSIVH